MKRIKIIIACTASLLCIAMVIVGVIFANKEPQAMPPLLLAPDEYKPAPIVPSDDLDVPAGTYYLVASNAYKPYLSHDVIGTDRYPQLTLNENGACSFSYHASLLGRWEVEKDNVFFDDGLHIFEALLPDDESMENDEFICTYDVEQKILLITCKTYTYTFKFFENEESAATWVYEQIGDNTLPIPDNCSEYADIQAQLGPASTEDTQNPTDSTEPVDTTPQ